MSDAKSPEGSGRASSVDALDAGGIELDRSGEPGRIRCAVERLLSPSRQRLVGDLNGFRIQVETFEDRLEAAGEDTFRTETACRLLDEAERALARGDTIAVRHYLYAAKRWQLIVAHQLNEVYAGDRGRRTDATSGAASEPTEPPPDGGTREMGALGISPLSVKAWRLRAEATETLSGWRRRAVDTLLPNPESVTADGETDPVTINELLAASRILHEFYIDRAIRRKVLGHQFLYFITTTVITVALILTSTTVSGFGPIFGDGIDMTAPSFLVPIVLFGVLGASVSGILTLGRVFKRQRLPEHLDNVWLAIARVSMGAAAALGIFAFLQSGLLQIGPQPSAGVTLTVAFTAGFSERLLVRAVNTVAGSDSGEDGTAWGVAARSRPPLDEPLEGSGERSG